MRNEFVGDGEEKMKVAKFQIKFFSNSKQQKKDVFVSNSQMEANIWQQLVRALTVRQ
jgi:hypothetical protein